jgi:dephospho-CoA kinase
MPILTNYPSVLIYGAPGSGKTTFAEQEVKRLLECGYQVIVCDPHAAFGAWQGCEVVGGGMNYDAIVRSNGLRQKFVADTKLLSRNLTPAFNL